MAQSPVLAAGRIARESFRQFSACTRGNVAMMFGVASLAILAASGMAIDFARQSSAVTGLQSAVDSVALALAKEVDSLSEGQLSAKAQSLFDALTAGGPLSGVRVVAKFDKSSDGSNLAVSADDSIPALFGAFLGMTSLPVKAASNVPISNRPAEIALVMDNTGSMNAQNKMGELKRAAANLVTAMESASARSRIDIKVSLVPFSREVRIGEENSGVGWLDWSAFRAGRSTWTGCVLDREPPYDVKSAAPTLDSDTWYPTGNCQIAKLMPLTNSWSDLRARIAEMRPIGNTNLTIGLAWGYNMLTYKAPLSNSTSEPNKYNRYLILLTDGLNTENRWTTDSVAIDSRTLEACAQIKSAGIQIFTVRVIDGNANLLRACASRPDMYHSVTEASQLSGVFEQIGATVRNALYLNK